MRAPEHSGGSLRDRIRAWTAGRADVLLLALVVFALPHFYWPGTTDPNTTRCVFAIVAVSLVTIARAAIAARRGHDRVAVPWIVWPLLAFIAASLVSLVGATDARSGGASLVVVLAFSQLALLIANAVRQKRDATLVLSALFASACVVAVHALLQYTRVLPSTIEPAASRMITTLGNPDIVAGLLACTLLPGVLLVDRARSRALKAVLALGVALLLTTVLLTEQMGALIGLFAALIAILTGWIAFRPKADGRHGVAPTLALLAAIGAVLLAGLAVRTLPGILSTGSVPKTLWEANSGEARAMFWNVALAMWQENPIAGVGLANYKTVYPTYEAQALARPGATPPSGFIANAAQVHNDYLQAAAELGWLGILALVGLFAVLGISVWKRLRADASWNRFDLLVLLGGVAVFVVHAFVGFPAHLAGTALAAIVLLGLALSPAHGTAAVHVVSLSRPATVALLIVSLAAGGAASVFAGRDLAANVLQLRGTRLLQTGYPQQALEVLERSLALDANPRIAIFYLASAQYRVGRYRDALDSLEMCLTRFPDENAFLLYADLAAGLGELDRGIEVLDFLLRTNPSPENATKARYVRALILRAKGNVAASEAALRDLVARVPDYEAAYIALAEIAAAAGRTEEARSLFEQALAQVDASLPLVRQTVSGLEPVTYAAYARANDRLQELTRERETILRGLAALPAARP